MINGGRSRRAALSADVSKSSGVMPKRRTGRRLAAALVPLLVLAAFVGTGTAASAASSSRGAVASSKVKQVLERGAAQRHEVRPSANGGSISPSISGGSASLATPQTALTTVTGPALLYTDNNTIVGGTAVHARDLAAATVTLTPPNSDCPFEPRLSPDGTKIVVVDEVCTNGSNSRIVVDNVSGGSSVLVTAPTNAFIDLPNWSPDGSTILYSLWQDDGSGHLLSTQLYTVPATGGSPTAIGGAGVDGWDGVYSPDGTEIALAPAYTSPSADYLGIMNADGSNLRVLTQTAITTLQSPLAPAWSPDGTKLSMLYLKNTPTAWLNFGLATVNADDTGLREFPVTSGASIDVSESSWSADGTELLYAAENVNTTTGAPSFNSTIFGTDVTGIYRTTVLAATSSLEYFDPALVAPGPSTGSASTFTPITPTRVQSLTSVPANGSLDVQVSGGSSPVPAGATAVTLNVTGVKPATSAFLSVYPRPDSGTAVPKVSNLNLAAGQNAAVAVQVTVPASGYIRIHNTSAGATGVIVDVSGYFTAGTAAAGFFALPQPFRVRDATIGQGQHADVTVTGLAGAPPNPTAVVFNLTGATPTKSTHLSVVPAPFTTAPAVSNLNLIAGVTRANLVTAQIGAGGQVSVFNFAGNVRTIVDVVGYYSSDPGGLAYYPLTPTRVLDTRYGTGTRLGSTASIGQGKTYDMLAWGTSTTHDGIVTLPSTAQALVANFTVARPSATTYLTVYATPGGRPLSSNLNVAVNTVVPNLVITAIGTAGHVGVYNNAGFAPTLADLAGYYAP